MSGNVGVIFIFVILLGLLGWWTFDPTAYSFFDSIWQQLGRPAMAMRVTGLLIVGGFVGFISLKMLK